MRWNQFRKAHTGMKQSEISELWAKYKAGEYEVPRNVEGEQGTKTVEKPRKKEEVKKITKSNKKTIQKKMRKRGML